MYIPVSVLLDYCMLLRSGFIKCIRIMRKSHQRALRYFFVFKYAPTLAITGDVGWEPCEVH